MPGDHTQAMLHGAMPDAHGAGLLSVNNPHGMIPIGGGPGVISVTNRHALMSVTESPQDLMLHVTDQHGILQHFGHVPTPQRFDDPFPEGCGSEPLKDVDPQSDKGAMHDAGEDGGADVLAKDSNPAMLYGTDADALLVTEDSEPPLKEEDLHGEGPPDSKRVRLSDDTQVLQDPL